MPGVFMLLTACGSGGTDTGAKPAPVEMPQPTQIGSTAPSIGMFDDVEEHTLNTHPRPDPARAGYYGYGETATPEMIAGWDIDIRPDGKGLPPGSGTAEQGEPIYEKKCSTCHGVFGEGAGRWPKLAGREELASNQRPEKTVGNYWPYASTVWDYIHRAMPFFEPQSLGNDEVYAITAYVLYLNEIVEYDQELNRDNLASIEMPNRDGFYEDPRPDVHNVACMENCKDPKDIKITWDSTELGVTPMEHLQSSGEGEASGAGDSKAGASVDGAAIYDQACKLCHDTGVAGAPKLGDKTAWKERIAQGRDVLVDHALHGFQGKVGMMPPKGGQAQLTDDEVAAAVDHIVGQSQ